MSRSVASKSLSSNLRRESKRLNSSSNMYSYDNNLSSVGSLPSLTSNKAFPSDRSLDSPSRNGDLYSRLSGLADPHNSSGLFSEHTQAMRPTNICVRCGSMHSSICIQCSEIVCENTLTFYRKTRAAGAAVLFSKAFVEAGNSKLVKFIVFKLLRNGYEARKKQQLKMKSVVQKFFGTNTVYVPFAAWRRYTRQNIMERKNRTISTLEDKVKKLEMELRAVTSENSSLSNEVKSLHATLRENSSQLLEANSELNHLRDNKKKDRQRILGLCNLAMPLEKFTMLMKDTVMHEAISLRHYLNYAVSHIESHNYNNIFQDTVLIDLQNTQKEYELKSKTKKVNAPLAISTQIIVDWVTTMSRNASKLIDPIEKKSLDEFLPPCDEIKSIKDFRTGRDLIRLIVTLIWEYHRKEVNSMSYEIQQDNDSHNRRKSQQAPQLLSYENLIEIHKVMDSPIPLITIALKYAHNFFNVPQFKVLDIVAGKGEVIFALLATIMNTVKPLVHPQEYQDIGNFIGEYNDMNQVLWEIDTDKSSLTHFDDLITMWARYYDYDRNTGEPVVQEEEPIEDNINNNSSNGSSNEEGAAPANPTISQELFPQPVDYNERYRNLCNAIDLFLSNKEDNDFINLYKKSTQLTNKFKDLTERVSRSREERSLGIRMTTEVRQYVINTFMNRALNSMELLQDE